VLHGAAGIGKTSIAEMFKNFVVNRGRFSDGAYKVLLLEIQTCMSHITRYFSRSLVKASA
jgi:replication-associated recombination protein RarA